MEKTTTSDRDVLLVALFTFLTVFLWIFFELVKTAKTTTVSTNVAQTITQFSPTIDMTTLDALTRRVIY